MEGRAWRLRSPCRCDPSAMSAWALAPRCALCRLRYDGNADLWGHVRFGQDMLTHGAVRLSDAYSFTSDRPWINHEWLSEIAFAVAFNMLGPTGLNLCRILVVAAVLGLVWRASASLSDRHRVTMVVVCAVGTYMRAHAVRPQLFSLLMFAILLVLLKRSDDQRSLRPLVWVPALMAVWVNFHGGWIVGFGVFGLWCGRAALERLGARSRQIDAGSFICARCDTAESVRCRDVGVPCDDGAVGEANGCRVATALPASVLRLAVMARSLGRRRHRGKACHVPKRLESASQSSPALASLRFASAGWMRFLRWPQYS